MLSTCLSIERQRSVTSVVAASLMENPAVVGLLVAIPSAALGYLGYRRSRQNDLVAERAGIATTQSASIGQVVAGMDSLVANLQEDNRALREHVKELNVKLDQIISECQDLKRELAALSRVANPQPPSG